MSRSCHSLLSVLGCPEDTGVPLAVLTAMDAARRNSSHLSMTMDVIAVDGSEVQLTTRSASPRRIVSVSTLCVPPDCGNLSHPVAAPVLTPAELIETPDGSKEAFLLLCLEPRLREGPPAISQKCSPTFHVMLHTRTHARTRAHSSFRD